MPAKENYPGYSSTVVLGIQWALERVGFERHTVISFGPRSAIERLFGDIEKRIRQFWNVFIGTYTREGMERWVEAFAGFRNWKKDLKGVLS